MDAFIKPSQRGKNWCPNKKTVVIEAHTHTTHRRRSEIMFTNFIPPPTGVRYLVTWLRLNILLPFCVQHPLSLQTCCFKTTNFKQKRMFTNKCYYKEYHFCYFLKKKYDSVCVCVRF